MNRIQKLEASLNASWLYKHAAPVQETQRQERYKQEYGGQNMRNVPGDVRAHLLNQVNPGFQTGSPTAFNPKQIVPQSKNPRPLPPPQPVAPPAAGVPLDPNFQQVGLKVPVGQKKPLPVHIPGLNPTAARTLSQDEIDRDWDRWNDVYNKHVKNTPITAPARAENRPGAYQSGARRPAIYDPSVARYYDSSNQPSTALTNGTRKEDGTFVKGELERSTPDDFQKGFTEYANRIRPEGLRIKAWTKPSAHALQGKMTLGSGNNTLHYAAPATAFHELTHTMQRHGKDDGIAPIDNWGRYETPAILGGAAQLASQMGRNNPNAPELDDVRFAVNPTGKGLSVRTMGNQFNKYIMGNDVAGNQVAPARSMNEVLSDPASINYLKMLSKTRNATPSQPQPRTDLAQLQQQAPDLDWNNAEAFLNQTGRSQQIAQK